jgi:hypothetical protein
MKSYKWSEALVASGSSPADPVMLQDTCLEDWLRGRKFQVIEFDVDTHRSQVEEAKRQGVEIVIIKEKSNDTA